jgi:hypothetical protein
MSDDKRDPAIEVAVVKPEDAGFDRVHYHSRWAYSQQAGWVTQLVQACAMPQPDGETSNGNQKYRLPTPAEAVERAFTIADGLLAEFERRGWAAPVPPLDELRSGGEAVGFLAKKGGQR